MVKKQTKTLVELRNEVREAQRNLLQEIWEHFRSTGEWPILRVLYSKDGKEVIKEALWDLGRSVGWEETPSQPWTRYRLSLLGTFLTNDGPELQKLFAKFFEFQRDLFYSEPAKALPTSTEISEKLGLDDEQTILLGKLISLGNLGGSHQNPPNKSWSVDAMAEAADFPKTGGLVDQVDQWVCRFYEPNGIVFQDQHLAQYSSGRAFSPTLTVPHSPPCPAEIALSVERLRNKYPDQTKIGFLIMRFAAAKPFQRIVDVIKATGESMGS